MNGTMLQAFEWHTPADGQHWKLLRQKARRLKWLGITSLWLPPACKGAGGAQDVGYGIYDPYDLGRYDQKGTVRTKYGTEEEFLSLVRRLNRLGLHPLCDMVMNHRMGADEQQEVTARRVSWNDRGHFEGDEVTGRAWTRFTYPGRPGADFLPDQRCFNGVDHIDGCENGLYLLRGKEWAWDTDRENGNYDYLMGLNCDVNDPVMRGELIRWGRWFYRTTGCFGFRLDAVKHISASFMKEWMESIRAGAGREVYMVGEYWNYDTDTLLRYLEAVGDGMNLFDVPLHGRLQAASSSGGSFDMRGLFPGTLVDRRDDRAVTFVDNHDTQPGQSLESWVGGWFKPAAYGLILLRSIGYPCVFWGDLTGIPESGIDPVRELPRLLRLRKYNALGAEHTWFDHEDLIGFTRQGDQTPDSGLAFLCTNRLGGEKRMYVGQSHAGETWRCVIGDQRPTVIDSDGYGTFRVRDGGASCYAPTLSLRGLLYRVLKDLLP